MFTQTQLDNLALKLQCCIANESVKLAKKQVIGGASNKNRRKFILANIYWVILREHNIEDPCLDEREICAVIKQSKSYCKDCGC